MINPTVAVVAVIVVEVDTDNVGDRSDEITWLYLCHYLCCDRVLPSEVATLLIFSPELTQVTSVPASRRVGTPATGPARQTERTDEHSRSGGLQIQMGSTQRYLLLLLLH